MPGDRERSSSERGLVRRWDVRNDAAAVVVLDAVVARRGELAHRVTVRMI